MKDQIPPNPRIKYPWLDTDFKNAWLKGDNEGMYITAKGLLQREFEYIKWVEEWYPNIEPFNVLTSVMFAYKSKDKND